jgi:hypothetical protein
VDCERFKKKLLVKTNMFVELFLAMCFGLLLWYYVTQPGPNYPKMPPIRLPFFGHSLYVKGYKNMQEAIMDLMEKYGQNGVLALHMGPGRAVFVQNLAFIKEAFKKEELNYRYPNERVHDMISRLRGGYGRHGIISRYRHMKSIISHSFLRCSSTQEVAWRVISEPTEIVAHCFGYPKTPYPDRKG